VNYKKILRYILSLAVLVIVGYFFYLEFKKNGDAIRAYHFTANPYYIFTAFIFATSGFLTGTFVWQICVNNFLQKKLSFWESLALYNTTTMLKYIPGKVWTYAAQMALLSSKGISKTVVLYINMICFICFAFVSAIYTLYYYLFCLQITPWGVSILIFILLIALDFVFIIWNTSIVNYLIIPINRILKIEIQSVKMRKIVFVYVQLLYLLAYVLLAMGTYLLAKGMGLDVSFSNMFALIAMLSVSAVSGLIAFFTLGGLGVREGMMFVLLKQFSNVGTALILPIALRCSCIIIDLFLGIIGIFVGMRYGYFPRKEKIRQAEKREIMEEETKAGTNYIK
jgi:glycosyltransferase 2 family protein